VKPPLTLVGTPVVLPGDAVPEPGGPAQRDDRGVAVWDVDGTLIRGDTLLPFLRRFVGTIALGRTVLASAAHRQHRLDARSAAKAAVLQRVLGGRQQRVVDQVARTYAADLMRQRMRPDCLRRWQWHRQRGHRLVLASASLEEYLRPLGMLLGADEVIASRMEVVNGWLSGRMATTNCRGKHKAERVHEHLRQRGGHPVWVYGNSAADRPTMALADFPIAVGPLRLLRTGTGE
jgi:phosphatidylglycerophosphatase C